ncbi:MAG: hypothetical protein LLF96_04945 [Eubacteriales bacterium]|nr:hypothetical protein [Eubacteriales bacterium]
MFTIEESILTKQQHERMIMVKYRRWLAVFMTSLLLLLSLPGAALQEAETAAPEIENTLYPIDYVYTSALITAYYHLYGKVLDDFAEINVTNHSDSTAWFLVETEMDGYSYVSSDTVEVEPGETQEVRQNPRLIPESMEKLNAQRYANFLIRVTLLKDGEDEMLLSESSEILLYSRRDYTWVDGFDVQENRDLLAVYVTPNDPDVEALLRRAADYTSSGQIWSGYGEDENDAEGGVWDRLQAIWQAEKEYDLTYVSTWVSFTPIYSQRIRLPFEVLEQSGGNCIELAFLYASAVEALDMECSIVLIPGHAYLAVRTDLVNAIYYFIETTLIGQADFNDAVTYGNNRWEEDSPNVDANKEDYGWINIGDAREWGILPVPWR